MMYPFTTPPLDVSVNFHNDAEARGGLHIVEQSLWAAMPAYMRKLNAALKKHTGRELPIGTCPLTFASWMGGDRDGNPNVTAQVMHCSSHMLISH